MCPKHSKFWGKPPPPPPFILHPPPPSPFILNRNSPLLATFYTLSFIDYIHDATHLLTLLTLLTLLNLTTKTTNAINLINLPNLLSLYIYTYIPIKTSARSAEETRTIPRALDCCRATAVKSSSFSSLLV